MTYEQFWDGEVEMARAYRKAHELKQEEANHFAWLQGAYVYSAIGSLAPALKAFAKGRAHKYLEKPFENEKKTPQKPKPQQNKAVTWMELWAANFNTKFEEKQEMKGGAANG